MSLSCSDEQCISRYLQKIIGLQEKTQKNFVASFDRKLLAAYNCGLSGR